MNDTSGEGLFRDVTFQCRHLPDQGAWHHLSDIPRGVVLRVGDPVVVDDQDWIIAGVDMVSPRPDDTIGVLVRRMEEVK